MTAKTNRIPPLPSVQLRDDMVLTYAEAGAYLRYTERQVRRLIEEGRLTCHKPSPRRTRIYGIDVREFLENAEHRPADHYADVRPRKRRRTA